MNSTDLEIEIRECEARLLRAQFASDVAELDALIAEELIFVGPDNELASKAMDLAAHHAKIFQFSRLELQKLEIHKLGSAAATIAIVSLAGTVNGVAFEGDFRYARIWRKAEKGWQIVGGGCGTAG